MEHDIIIICDDDFDGILSAIYDAWTYKLKGRNVKIEVGSNQNIRLFSDYIEVSTDYNKSNKVAKSIKEKLSEDIYQSVYRAAMSTDIEKADIIFHFLIDGFKVGKSILQHLTNPYVYRIFELDRNVGRESHLFLGFVRFSELKGNVLFSKISPVNNILSLIAPHFTDRFSGENWVIYDENRQLSAVHESNKGWFLLKNQSPIFGNSNRTGNEDEYEDLWKVFFQSISIESRRNYRLQRGNIPLRYRGNMLEFQE